MAQHLAKVSTIVVLCCTIGILGENTDSLTEHEKNVICREAVQFHDFCPKKGPADDGCKHMAEQTQGTNPTCSGDNMCSFKSKSGKTAYVSSQDKPGALSTVKDCRKGVSVVNKPGGGGHEGGGGDKGSGGGDKGSGGGDKGGDKGKNPPPAPAPSSEDTGYPPADGPVLSGPQQPINLVNPPSVIHTGSG